MSDSPDAQLQLKKRARRRLVGAVAFAGLAAVILPMVMDEEPKQQVQDIQIRIPGQDAAPFNPRLKPADTAKEERAGKAESPVPVPVAPPPVAAARQAEAPAAKAPEKPAEKPANKPAEKPAAKPVEKPAEKPLEKASNGDDAKRAASILSGKAAADAAPANGNGQFVILIGAFANPANVKQLQSKIGEMGIKVFTEPLESPGGTKTRVRAGPFPNREAADKALEKIKRIGVNGVVAAKQ